MAVSVYTGAGGGVASFNGRKGKVVPADGDYTKAQVGLSNVDNTSDANKPISNATQAALNDKQSKITANGILKGDGSGNVTAANETEVELVSLPNICNPNLLDNWYFGNPVNQRGQTSYAGTDIYTIDRWKTENTVTVVDGGIMVKRAGGDVLLRQYLEDSLVEAIAGKVVTISALTTNGLMVVTTTCPSVVNVGWDLDNAIQGNLVLDIYGPSTGLKQFRFYSTVDGTEATIKAVKLELGSQQTLAHQENGVWVLNEIPDYGEQLRRCQRYYRQSWVGEISSLSNRGCVGFCMPAGSDINSFPVVNWECPMRTVPTVTVYDYVNKQPNSITNWYSDEVIGGITTNWISEHGFALSGMSVKSIAAGTPLAFHYIASADL